MDGEHIVMGVEEDTGVHYIEIIEATEDDEGTYICTIATELGIAESTFTLVVESGNCVYLHKSVLCSYVFLCVVNLCLLAMCYVRKFYICICMSKCY